MTKPSSRTSESTPVAAAILTAITDLAGILKLDVIAEGVETQLQRDEAVLRGCTSAQGFFYADAMPAGDIEQLLKRSIKGHPRLLADTMAHRPGAAVPNLPHQQAPPRTEVGASSTPMAPTLSSNYVRSVGFDPQ